MEREILPKVRFTVSLVADTFPPTMDALKCLAFAFPLALVLGCSPTGDPVARGSAHYRTKSCLMSYGGVGAEVDSGHGVGVPDLPRPPSTPSDNTGGLVLDGELSPNSGTPYEISCSVTGTTTLRVRAQLQGPNTSPGAADEGSVTKLDLNASIDAATGIGSGTVGFYTTDSLGASPITDTLCTIVATPSPLHVCSDKGCTGEARDPGETGRIWLEFYCDEVTVEATGMENAGCQSDGTIVMERCTVD